MKKIFTKIGFVVLILFAFFEIAQALPVNSSEVFGGKIINTKATEVQELEDSGYDCTQGLDGGSTVTINPIKGPNTYFIPENVTSKTGREITIDKWIMGKYSDKKQITCKKECEDSSFWSFFSFLGIGDKSAECEDSVTLDSVIMFGAS